MLDGNILFQWDCVSRCACAALQGGSIIRGRLMTRR